MPHSKLTPDLTAADDASRLSILRKHDYGRPLMDLAQRQLHPQNELIRRT